mmetsp:Transcript_22658/g.31055  ORF Transcript_22658/g.31055 Transcript_22658/m.31055 type:complete len:113 (-) Transcript_22658:131-469(-)
MQKKNEPKKPLNPEERLQASVARDVKIRQLEEHQKIQSNSVATAKWEEALCLKDELAAKKRLEEQTSVDSRLMKTINKATRRARLEELYKFDEIRYEEELSALGLAFRRDRS